MIGMLVHTPRSSRYQPDAASAPPSMCSVVPVIHAALSLARNRMPFAMSIGVPKRPSGIQLGMCLAFGTVAVVAAQDAPKKETEKKGGKKKGGKKKDDAPKKEGGK